MTYYPICLDIRDRLCVVVGGGAVAERKAERLLDCGARVTLVAPDLTPNLTDMRAAGRICHIAAAYGPEVLDGAFLAVAATDDRDVNDAVFRDGRRLGVLVNVVDVPDRCDFTLPSVLQRGDLTIAVSTAGKSPALARRIREELERAYGEEYALLLELLGQVRECVRAEGGASGENRDRFEALLDQPLLEAVRRRDWPGLQRMILEATGCDVPLEGRET